MKTIFITISRGLLARNILRSGVVKALKADNNKRLVVLVPKITSADLPEYFIKECVSKGIEVEIVNNFSQGRLARMLSEFFSRLVFSKSKRLYFLYNINPRKRVNRAEYALIWLVYSVLSRMVFLKKIARKIDSSLLKTDCYAEYFEKYSPDLVFSTSIVSSFDIEFLREAKSRRIKTCSMPKSWDNLDKFFFRAEPDVFMVQNNLMKKDTVKYQHISEEKIRVVGFPQFDIYCDDDIFYSKDEYCKNKSFDSALPILFLGSEGAWTRGDDKIFESIVDARNSGKIPNCNILVRPHFSDINVTDYSSLKNQKNVFIDDQFRKTDFFVDHWDPGESDIRDFANSLYHCNLMITFASTLALDAACFDKPIIAINYGIRYVRGKDSSHVIYETCHYENVLATGAVTLVASLEELIKKINDYSINPDIKKMERQKLVDKLCYRIDGRSSERVGKIIKNMLG